MATLQNYKDIAPLVMGTGGFTLSQVETKLASIPDAPVKAGDPAVTKAQVIAIFNTVFAHHSVTLGVARSGGFGQLAKDNNLRPYQAKQEVKELSLMVGLYNQIPK